MLTCIRDYYGFKLCIARLIIDSIHLSKKWQRKLTTSDEVVFTRKLKPVNGKTPKENITLSNYNGFYSFRYEIKGKNKLVASDYFTFIIEFEDYEDIINNAGKNFAEKFVNLFSMTKPAITGVSDV